MVGVYGSFLSFSQKWFPRRSAVWLRKDSVPVRRTRFGANRSGRGVGGAPGPVVPAEVRLRCRAGYHFLCFAVDAQDRESWGQNQAAEAVRGGFLVLRPDFSPGDARCSMTMGPWSAVLDLSAFLSAGSWETAPLRLISALGKSRAGSGRRLRPSK